MERRRAMMAPKGGGEIDVPANQIWYDADEQVTLYSQTKVVSHIFSNGRGIVTLSSNITTVGDWLRGTSISMVYFPDGITSIGLYSFRGCTNLALSTLPSGLTSLGSGAFYGCTRLALTTLPSGLTSISADAFRGCTRLTITALPSGVTSIGARVFYNCTSIISLTILSLTPPSLGADAFSLTSYPVYVPSESVETYKAASGWSTYASRIFPIPE